MTNQELPMGPYRKEVCDIVSEMLDNPYENGIYPTSKCYQELDALIEQAVRTFADKVKTEALDVSLSWSIIPTKNAIVVIPYHELEKLLADIPEGGK